MSHGDRRRAATASLVGLTLSACVVGDEGRMSDELERATDDTQTLERRISSSQDDAEEKASGTMYMISSDLEFVDDAIHQTERVGMRFTGVTIPPGATIERAYIQFTADEQHSARASLVIRAHDTDDAGPFTSSNGNISSRSSTTASVDWSPLAWTTKGAATSNERTPDIKSVVQEIVDRSGWSSGNDLAIIVSGSGTRTAKAFDGSSSEAPLLHVEYTYDGEGGGDGGGGGDDGGGGGGSGGEILYENKGGVNKSTSNATVSSEADAGDYEIVAVGASNGSGSEYKDIPLDRDLMEGQDFHLVGVRGTKDKKAEIWIRRHDGSSSQQNIKITGNGKDVAWSITTIKGSGLNLDFDAFTTEMHTGSHSNKTEAKLETPSGDGFTFVNFFFDDSVELEDAGKGDILFKTWGHGDGDGLATVLYQPDEAPPLVSYVDVDDHDGSGGGEQYVTVAFKSNH